MPAPRIHYHGLDALRIFAMFAVVLLHAAIAYVHTPPPSLIWPVWDVQGRDDAVNSAWIRYVMANETMPQGWPDAPEERARIAAFDAAARPVDRVPDVIVLWGRNSAVPLFFALAGMLAAQSRQSCDTRKFVRGRLRRLGLPLLWGVLILLPLTYIIWSWGWIVRGWTTPSDAAHFILPLFIKQSLVGPAHLWFIEYLLLYSLLFALLPRVRRMPSGVLLALVIGIAASFYVDPEMLRDFRNSFIPRPFFFAANGLFFALGASIDPSFLANPRRARLWPACLLLAHAAFALWLWVLWHEHAPTSYRAACAAAAFSIFSVLGWLNLFLRFGRSARAAFVSGRTLGIYFVHLPIVAAVQILLYHSPLPALIKILIVTAAGFGGSLAIILAWQRFGPQPGRKIAVSPAQGSPP